jgi:hypothetical protein
MADKIHTFIIEVPADLALTPEEIAALEIHFQQDAGHILDQRMSEEPPTQFTNVGAVRVITKLQPEGQPKGGGESSTQSYGTTGAGPASEEGGS